MGEVERKCASSCRGRSRCFMAAFSFWFLNLQKFNADFDLSAREGADSLAFISLMEEKLTPALVRHQP